MRKNPIPIQLDENSLVDLEKMAQAIRSLPHNKLTYVAGALGAFAIEEMAKHRRPEKVS